MNPIKNELFNNLKNQGPDKIPSTIKKCIYQGFTSPDDLKFYSDKTYQFIDEFSLSHTTSLLHSFSIPIYRNFQLFTTLTNRIRNQLKLESPSIEDSIKIINSCGRLHYSDSQLFPILLEVVKDNIESVRAKNIVSIIHSLTKLRFTDNELLSDFAMVAIRNLDTVSDVALANFSIACSKIYNPENTENKHILENGKSLVGSLLPEIKLRSSVSSPLDNLRHLIALSGMKHLIKNGDELEECLDKLLKFINFSVLYYEHLIILLECVCALNYSKDSFVVNNLVPSLLNKRTENNSTVEFDLRLLRCLSRTPNLSRSCEFLLDQILENLSKNMSKQPKLMKHTFSVINTIEVDPAPFLSKAQEYLETSTIKCDADTINEIRSSIKRSDQSWNRLESLMENSI